MILAGDIGGFKTSLALFDEQLRLVIERPDPGWDFDGLKTLVLRFRGEAAAGAKSETAAALMTI